MLLQLIGAGAANEGVAVNEAAAFSVADATNLVKSANLIISLLPEILTSSPPLTFSSSYSLTALVLILSPILLH